MAQGKGPDPKTCDAAHEQTPLLHGAGKVQAALDQASICSAATCAKPIRTECAQWLTELDASLPTVIFEGQGPNDPATSAVQVSLDGSPWFSGLDRRVRPIDPGTHTLRYEMPGVSPVVETIEIREGEKNRKVTVAFPKPGTTAAGTTGGSALGTPGGAAATDPQKAACGTAYEFAQTLRAAGKLQTAREHALICARDVCAEFVRKDCATWLADLDARQPTVVFDVRGPDGQPTTAVRVTLDGNAWLASLDNQPKPMDPGQHTLRYEMEGAAPVDATVQVREGEKNRQILAAFRRLPTAVNPRPLGAKVGPTKMQAPVWPWWVGGAGVALGGTAIILGVVSVNNQSYINQHCAAVVLPSDCNALVTNNNTEQGLAITSGILGVIGIGVGIWGLLSTSPSAADTAQLSPILGPGVAGASWKGAF
jgi:hypothetical protein